MINTTYLPLVSVVIPTYNRCYSLQSTIESAINQSYKNIEIIIVDDGSIDNTKNLVSSFGSKIVYIQKAHTGQADTRNVGLQYAKGEIIAPLDSDDIWDEKYLEKSICYMIENKLDMFFSNWKHYISPTHYTIFLDNFLNNLNIKNDDFYLFEYIEFRKILLSDSVAPSSGLLIKKDCIPFGWNSKVHIGDDWFLQLEMIFKNLNCRIGFTKQVLWKKNRDASNICDGRKGIAFRKLHIQDLNLILNTFSFYLDNQERQMIHLKVVQNKILIFYLLLLEGNIGIEMKKLLIEIIKEPQLFLIAFMKGIKKNITKKINQLTSYKNQ